MYFWDLLIEPAFSLVELVWIFDWFQLYSESLLLESHPVLFIAINGDNNLFKDVCIFPTKVAIKEGVAIRIVLVEFDLAVTQFDDSSRIFKLYSFVVVSKIVLSCNFEVGFVDL